MAHRQFRDAHGRDWDVWTVIPDRAERRLRNGSDDVAEDRRHYRDPEVRVKLGEQWIRGWLAFETRGEKRRLAPIPDQWENSSDDELEALCNSAQPVAPSKRLAE
jgi:hypothetical protein